MSDANIGLFITMALNVVLFMYVFTEHYDKGFTLMQWSVFMICVRIGIAQFHNRTVQLTSVQWLQHMDNSYLKWCAFVSPYPYYTEQDI